MGVTFRSGGYICHVLIGGRTIKDGEAAAIWNAKGIHKQIFGPYRVVLYNSTIRFLMRHKAESHQYLRVSHHDGRVEHIVGPAVLYENPAYHDNISVEDGLCLCSEFECIVTFSSPMMRDHDTDENTSDSTQSNEGKKDMVKNNSHDTNHKKTKTVSKQIIYGPTLFIPQPSEYVHTFSWSGVGLNEFQIICTVDNTSLEVTIPTLDSFTFDVTLVLSFNTTSINELIRYEDVINELYNGIKFDSQTLPLFINLLPTHDIIFNSILKTKHL